MTPKRKLIPYAGKETAMDSDSRPQPKGEKWHASKLTAADVVSIRSRYTGAFGELKAFGLEFNVGPTCIRKIIDRKNWKSIP